MKDSKLMLIYKRIPINVDDMLKTLSQEKRKQAISDDLLELCFLFNINVNNKKIIRTAYISKDGLFFDFKHLKAKLFNYFGIDQQTNATVTLDKIIEDVEAGKLNVKAVSDIAKAEYKKFITKRYIPYNAKKSTVEKIKMKEYSKLLKKRALLFKDFLINENKYSELNDVFDEYCVMHLAALTVLEYAKRKKALNDEKEKLHACEFLKLYTEYAQATDKQYEINNREILEFLNIGLNKNETPKYNYSFFEIKYSGGKDFLKKVSRYSAYYDNSEELKILLERKIKFYETLGFVSLKIGKDSFDGYVGFELPSNYVILERFFENQKSGKIAKDNAIYIVRTEDFEKITRMSKTEAMKAINEDEIEAKRVFHSRGFEERVMGHILK